MSFIDGHEDPGDAARRAPTRSGWRASGWQTLLKMIFEDGFVHADLHPGNIFITPDDKLALLDLGLVGELDEPHRKGFARFFAAWAQRDGDTMARVMYELSTESADPAGDPERVRALPRRDHRVRRAATGASAWARCRSARCCSTCWRILRRHRVRVNPSFTIVNIAIAVTEGIGKQLDPELDLMAEALPYFLAHPVDTRRRASLTGA